MTNYEMEKISKLTAGYIVEAIKQDNGLIDEIYPPRCMNIVEASDYCKIPISTLYQKVKEIPHMKAGKRLVFTDRGLIRWMKQLTKEDRLWKLQESI